MGMLRNSISRHPSSNGK